MRLDKWLKVSRLIKRRTVANEACDGQRVSANGRAVTGGDAATGGPGLGFGFGERVGRVEVLSVGEHVGKGEAAAMYKEL